jgi:hypothetical protein
VINIGLDDLPLRSGSMVSRWCINEIKRLSKVIRRLPIEGSKGRVGPEDRVKVKSADDG